MTPGHRKSTEAVHRSRRTWHWAPALMLVATALLAACGRSSPTAPRTVDTTPPSVVITHSVSGPMAYGDVTFSFTFSKDVGTSFTANSVAVTGGTKGTFTKVNETFYTLVVSPPPKATGTIAVSVHAGAFSDLAGKTNTATASAHHPFDTRPVQMTLPVTFDSANVSYGLLGFGGAEDSTIVVDPAGGTNKVAKVVKSATAELWAGTTLTDDGTRGFASRIPFSAGNTRMTVQVYSPNAGIPVRLKVEDHTNAAITCETEANTTKVNTWETLTFDFAKQAAGTAALDVNKTYDKASIFFNFGVTGATAGAKTYYFDDVAFIGGTTPAQMTLPVTFDSANVAYGLLGFGGAEDSTIVADPAGGSNKVAKVVKSATAELWAGTTLTDDGTRGFASKIPFTASATKMTVRVYSPNAGIQVRLKVEDHTNPAISVETEATTTKVNTWETLTFDFVNQATGTLALDVNKTYDKASIFFNFGVTGATAGAKTYYFDDVAFIGGTGGGGGGTGTALITFDNAAVTYTLTDFGGTTSSVVIDPTNAANQVAKVVKSATAETWAGTTVSTGANQSIVTIPFTATNKTMTVRVYSPDAGIKVRLKVEDAADVTHTCETEATTTVVNTWETLTFNFANQAAGTEALHLAYTFNKISIFFNFGVDGATAGAKTYYFDDVTFVSTGGGGGGGGGTAAVPVDFEDAGGPYTFSDFDGGQATVIANPHASGINTSAKVAQMKKFAGQPWGGSTLTLDAAVDFSGGSVFTMKVWSSRAVPVLFKLEGLNVEKTANHTGSSTWEELSFDFAGSTGAGVTAITIIFDLGVMGDAAGNPTNWTFYFDDIALTTGGGGGGGGGGALTTIDFEPGGFGAALTWNVFENVDNPPLQFVANPAPSGINTSATVARFTARQAGQPWAGTEIAHGQLTPFALDASHNKVKIMVYKSIISDVGIKFARGDGGSTGEIRVANTIINQWEELTFDFSAVVSNPNNQTIDQIIVFPDFNAARTSENIIYFDNIRLTN